MFEKVVVATMSLGVFFIGVGLLDNPPITTANSSVVASATVVKSNSGESVLIPSTSVDGKQKGANTAKEIKRHKIDSSRTLILEGLVEPGLTGSLIGDINRLYRENSKPIYLLINSPGGSVFDGSMLISAMESSKAPIYTVCVRICASMAFQIHQHGTKRLIVDRAVLMAHDASGGAQGNISNMDSMITFVRRFIDKDNAYVAKRVGLTFEQYKYEVLKNIWLDAEDSLKRKFADEIVSLNLESSFSPAEVFRSIPTEGGKPGSPKTVDFQWVYPQ